ncbi:hypothetical protein AQPE_1961 [Aquipluma nitroreducens]|uniref:Uncharacterized protein n=1 Tax=Aquipluma nitroreducens TaxID=2010828 RepID=A0A5K7S919_9BACT|nr:hypothetical protein [Aquipluma nitroreducens]BBE17804.1 hypothetical protein AQPE_1961 [Aquipluma nitroreducens]
MEQFQNIQSVIEYFSAIYSSWQEVNCLLRNKIQNPDSGDLSSQKFLYKFYNKNKESNVFQTNLLNLILASSAEKAGVVTTPLLVLLRENISLFENNKTILEDLNALKIIEQSLLYYQDKRVSLGEDLKLIKTYPYPSEVERQMLIDETRKELNELSGEEEKERNRIAPFCENFFPGIYQLGKELVAFINAYIPEKDVIAESQVKSFRQNISNGILVKNDQTDKVAEPDAIFRTRMFEKFLILERRLLTDKYLKEENQNKELRWISTHENGKPDIKRLVTFLAGMLDNNYFLPNKDPKIKAFFESRYHITIGQNFERKRRVPLLNEYKIVFHNYPF